MTNAAGSDDSLRPDGGPGEGVPFLPPARPAVPPPQQAEAVLLAAVSAPGETPTLPTVPDLPTLRAPEPASPAPASMAAPVFDARAMVESQKHYNVNPTYGPLPAGTDESRAAARRLREQANRKRRRNKIAGRVLAGLVVVAVAVGLYFAYQAIQDDPTPVDGQPADAGSDADARAAGSGDVGALTPLGEQEQVVEVLGDLNSGASPSAGGLLDAVDQARDVVGQAQPPVAAPNALMVADVFTPAVLDHTDVLDPADGYERFAVRTADLAAANPSAHVALVERLFAMPQVADGDPQLAAAPVVIPGDIAIAIQRDDDVITSIVAVAADPVIRAVGP
jgi:hypothetical protein